MVRPSGGGPRMVRDGSTDTIAEGRMALATQGLTFRVLGPFEMTAGPRAVPVGGPQLRTVLALMLVHLGRTMSVSALVRQVWAGDAPADAERTIRTYMSRLRSALCRVAGPAGSDRVLVTVPPGYALRVDPAAVDAHRFERMAAAGRQALAAGEYAGAVEQLTAALALWRGDAYAEFAHVPMIAAAGARLDQLRLGVVEDRIAALLAGDPDGGHAGDTVGDLEALVRAHPERERLWGQLMTALYRAGRQAEALAVFRAARAALVDRYGIEPSPQLTEIHRQILAQEPQLAAPPAVGATRICPNGSNGGRPAPAVRVAPPACTAPERPRVAPAGIAWPLPAQLPPAVPGFAGRTREMALLDEFLPAADEPVAVAPVVVSGPAGIGKTALAVCWAHRVAARFPDGRLYVNLRGFDPDEAAALDAPAVVRGFLDALGVPAARIPFGAHAQLGLYRSLLDGRRLLVLLDNARDVDQIRPLLPGAPGCLALVTSRNRLTGLVATDGARPLELDALIAEQARDVLDGRLGPRRVADEPEATRRIIARCGGLPLALSIAAARAATRPRLPLAALAAELDDTNGVLDTLGGEGDPATDLRAVFSWSYRTLSTAGARMFRLLGLPGGGDIGAAAAASLAGIPPAQARRVLGELLTANLVSEAAPGRYVVHDLLRAYGADLVSTEGDPAEPRAALRRLLDHYLHTAHAATLALHPAFSPIDLPAAAPGVSLVGMPTEAAAQAWFAAERATLLAAVPHAAQHGFEGHAWRLAWSMARDLDRHGYWLERLAAQRAALAAATRTGDPVGQAHCHRDLGVAHVRLGGRRQAADHLQRALELFARTGDPAGEAHTYINLAMLVGQQGDLSAALDHARQARNLFVRAANPAGQAYSLNAIGWKLTLLGDHHQAIIHCEHALDLIRAVGDRQGEADTWDSLGHAHHHLGRHDRAIACYHRAVALFDEVGDRYGGARTDINLAEACWSAGDHPAARTAWRRALATLDDLGHPDADQVRADLRRLAQVYRKADVPAA